MRILLIIVPLFLFAATCNKCALNKNQMKCEYYVAIKADKSKAKLCESYADYLDKTKVYGRAAWYYLLALKPKKAIEAAKNALKLGETYANEYLAESYLILGDKKKAKEHYKKLQTNFFSKKNLQTLQKLYPNFDPKELE